MNTISTELTVTLENLLATDDGQQLDQLLHQASEESNYASNLTVAWSYWHYGRHAEFAHDLGLPALSRLFSAAWAIEFEVHTEDDTEAANAARAAIRMRYMGR